MLISRAPHGARGGGACYDITTTLRYVTPELKPEARSGRRGGVVVMAMENGRGGAPGKFVVRKRYSSRHVPPPAVYTEIGKPHAPPPTTTTASAEAAFGPALSGLLAAAGSPVVCVVCAWAGGHGAVV